MSGWEAIVMGGSAGSLEALSHILPKLPENFLLPIMVVVHLPPDKKSVLAEVMQNKCKLVVREAQDKEPIESGTVYFAAPDYHLQVESDRCLSLSYDAPELFSRPSIDVLFETAADVYGDKLLAVVLSGANDDGAAGLKAVMAEGGFGLIQSPDEAFSAEMPESAIKACPTARILRTEAIANFLKEAV